MHRSGSSTTKRHRGPGQARSGRRDVVDDDHPGRRRTGWAQRRADQALHSRASGLTLELGWLPSNRAVDSIVDRGRLPAQQSGRPFAWDRHSSRCLCRRLRQQFGLIEAALGAVGRCSGHPAHRGSVQPHSAHHRQRRPQGLHGVAMAAVLQRRDECGGNPLVAAQRCGTIKPVGRWAQFAGGQWPQRFDARRARAGPTSMTHDARRPQPHP